MAVVSSAINGEAAGTRTTKVLFLICTLLSLICFTNSVVTIEQLKRLKEVQEKMKENLQKLKDYQISTSKSSLQLSSYQAMDFMAAEMKKYMPDDFPQMDQLVKSAKIFYEDRQAYKEKKNAELVEKIENLQKNIRKTKKAIDFLEERLSEL